MSNGLLYIDSKLKEIRPGWYWEETENGKVLLRATIDEGGEPLFFSAERQDRHSPRKTFVPHSVQNRQMYESLKMAQDSEINEHALHIQKELDWIKSFQDSSAETS